MATTTRYGKPNMAALPRDLGERIFKTIRSTPSVDYGKMHQEAKEWEQNVMSMREKRKNESK